MSETQRKVRSRFGITVQAFGKDVVRRAIKSVVKDGLNQHPGGKANCSCCTNALILASEAAAHV